MLTTDKRTQLDSIVSQMVANKEDDNTIQFVVNDFKNKYSVEESGEPFYEKVNKFFTGGQLSEAIGTGIAKLKATPEEKPFVAPAPPAKEVLGSALQLGALFAPVGTLAKGITGGVRALGLVKGASALGKIGAGALTGEIFDVALNLQQGKTGKDALTPGLATLIGGGIPAAGVAKNVVVRFGERQAPRVINSLIKPLAKDFSYGKNPGRAIAEEGIVANNFDDLIDQIRATRQKTGQSIGQLANRLSEQPLVQIKSALNPLDDAIKIAAKQNNPTLANRLNNVKRAITEVLEPQVDDTGNLSIISKGSRDLENLTFQQARNILTDIGDMTQFTGNISDDKLVNSALKKVYGSIKDTTLKFARAVNPEVADEFSKLTEKYADLHSAEIAAKYRDKIVERQNLIGLSPTTVGVGSALITAVATGGATIPALIAGASGAIIEKLATTPGFKTRLAYMLSKKTTQEANFLFKKIPALSKFFSTESGVFPGDIILGENGEVISRKIGEFIQKPKIGLIAEDVSKGISKELQPLAQEARKYKSAEEFVKAQGELYHGTYGEIKNFSKIPTGYTETGVKRMGSFLTENKNLAKQFGDTVNTAYFTPKKTLNLVDVENFDDLIKKLDIKTNDWEIRNMKSSSYYDKFQTLTGKNKNAESPYRALEALNEKYNLTRKLRAKGYDSISFTDKENGKVGKTIVVIKNDLIKTKSQLTDFYNQAVKGMPPKAIDDQRVFNNFLEAIDEGKKSGVFSKAEELLKTIKGIDKEAMENTLRQSKELIAPTYQEMIANPQFSNFKKWFLNQSPEKVADKSMGELFDMFNKMN